MLAFLPVLAQLVISASAPDTVSVGEPFLVVVEVRASSVAMPRIVVPGFSPLAVIGSRTSSRQALAGSRPQVSVELEYQLEAARPGRYTVPPFIAYVGADSAQSRPLSVTVVSTGRRPPPAIIGSARIDTSVTVSVSAAAHPDTVYVGQQATYQVGLFIDEVLSQQLTRAPTLAPPEMRSLLTYDLPAVTEPVPRVIGSHRFDSHIFQRAVFPLGPGTFVIPPAQLEYALPTSYGFFSRPETFVLRTDSVALVVRELPTAGRPPDFHGATGQLRVDARVQGSGLRVGDPALLVVRVSGTGNLKLLPRPDASVPWALLVPTSERVQIDTGSAIVRGTKEFEWVLTPRVAGSQTLPAMRYPFFDPVLGQYDVALTTPETLTVEDGVLVAAEEAKAAPPLPLRSEYRASPSDSLPFGPVSWMLAVLAPVPAAFLTLVRRPRRRREPVPAQRLRDIATAASPPDASAVRRAFVAALASRLGIPTGAFAARPDCVRALRRAGVTAETAVATERILGELDRASYGKTQALASDVRDRALAAYHAVAAEARHPSTGSAAAPLRTLLMGAGLVLSASAGVAEEHFDRGVTLYHARAYAEAQRAFGESARLDPRVSDSWANFGTASWMSGDTADAVVGWQRALRLEPTSRDVRERLATLSASDWRSPGWVAPVPAMPLQAAALLCWLAAWTMTAHTIATGRGRWARAFGSGAAALLLWGGSVMIADRLAAHDLVVLAGATPLRALPALAAESVARAAPGEVGRVVERGTDWSLVAVDGGRQGWVATGALISLARD